MNTAQQTATDKALADRDRQFRLYTAQKKAEYEELFAVPVHGPLLRKFNSTLGHFGIEDGDRLLEYVRGRNQAWLRIAPENIRHAALQMIGSRIRRIRERAGLAPFDDALPVAGSSGDDLFIRCKREIER